MFLEGFMARANVIYPDYAELLEEFFKKLIY